MKAHNLLLVCIIALLGASLYFNYEYSCIQAQIIRITKTWSFFIV